MKTQISKLLVTILLSQGVFFSASHAEKLFLDPRHVLFDIAPGISPATSRYLVLYEGKIIHSIQWDEQKAQAMGFDPVGYASINLFKKMERLKKSAIRSNKKLIIDDEAHVFDMVSIADPLTAATSPSLCKDVFEATSWP